MRKSQDDTAEYVVDINNSEEKDLTLPRIGTQAPGVRNKLIHKTQPKDQFHTLEQGKKDAIPIIRQADKLSSNRIILYKKAKQLGQGFYIVEISQLDDTLFIAAYDTDSPESLLIELQDQRAQDILTQFANNYETMACSLQVMSKRLVLLNPKFVSQRRLGTAPTVNKSTAEFEKVDTGGANLGNVQHESQDQQM